MFIFSRLSCICSVLRGFSLFCFVFFWFVIVLLSICVTLYAVFSCRSNEFASLQRAAVRSGPCREYEVVSAVLPTRRAGFSSPQCPPLVCWGIHWLFLLLREFVCACFCLCAYLRVRVCVRVCFCSFVRFPAITSGSSVSSGCSNIPLQCAVIIGHFWI